MDVEADSALELNATSGMISATGDGYAWYHAPLENGSDRYAILANGSMLAEGEIEVSMPPSAELVVDRITERDVAGRYGDVEFQATGVSTDSGSATFRLPGQDLMLEISIENNEAQMTWRGVSLDGRGALTEAQAAASRDLSTSDLARALTMIALDLGCREDARPLVNGAYAALLFPWQFILKYEVAERQRVIMHFLEASSCSFTGLVEVGVDEPLNVGVLWDRNHVIPMTNFIFPFDGEGQKGTGK